MTIEAVVPFNRDAVLAQSKKNNEPEWLTQLRVEALELAQTLELPKLEKTRINRWSLDGYGEYKQSSDQISIEQLPEDIRAFLSADDGSNLLVQQDSGVVYEKLAKEFADQGVIFTSLQTAVRDHADLVKPYLAELVKKDENKLTALHTALWSGGVFLYVPRNVEINIPVQALFLTSGEALFAPHILIVAEDNSSVTYVDNYISVGNSSGDFVHNGVAEVFVKPGAKVQYASIHNLDKNVTDLSYRRAHVDNDGSIDWIIGDMSEGNILSDTKSLLKGNGSHSNARVLMIGSDDQNINMTTHAVHYGLRSDSDMLTRAVMKDKSTAIINGITKIEKGATNANGEQTEKVLMLSPKARGDANPMLLIDEDEVTAGHAASAGQVDPNHIYYLMSRGISRKEAERLITLGFLEPIVSSIPLETVANQLQALVERKLER